MESQSSPDQGGDNNTLSLLGALLLIPFFSVLGLWIQTFSANPSASQAQKVEIFLGYFPSFLRSVDAVSTVVLLSTVAAILVSAFGLKRASLLFKVVGIVVIIVGSLATLWQLFMKM